MKEMSDGAFQGSSVARLVFPFSEGDRTKTELLGGKGANLAEMVGRFALCLGFLSPLYRDV